MALHGTLWDRLGLSGADNMEAFGSPDPLAEQLVVSDPGAMVGGLRMDDPRTDPAVTIAKPTAPDTKPIIDTQTMKRVLSGEITLADALLTSRQLMKTPQVKRVSEMRSRKSTEVEEPSYWDKFKKGAGDYFGDEENRANLAMAFNTMRQNPDQGIATAMGKKAAEARKSKGATKSIQWLRSYAMKQQDPAKRQKYMEMAIAAEQNPAMAKDIIKAVMQQAHGVGTDMPKSFAPQIDADGKEYITVFSPSSNSVERQYTGSEGRLTERGKISFKVNEEQRGKDIARKDEAVAVTFASAESIGSELNSLQGIANSLDEGAISGWLTSAIPKLSTASAELKRLSNELGLKIISSVTFGALSEKELKLAMDTAVPGDLGPKELKAWVTERIDARKKLQVYLYQQAQEMSGFERYSEWITHKSGREIEAAKMDYYSLPKEMTQSLTASGITREVFKSMPFSQRKKLVEQYRK